LRIGIVLGFSLVSGFVACACASSETTTAPAADAGTIDPPLDDAAIADSSSPSDAGSKSDASDAAAKDTGTPSGNGSCVAPKTVTLPYSETAGSTAVALDTTSVACGAPASLSEAVYRLELANDTAVKVTANDKSGQGIGVQVREDSCTGTSVECGWQSNGIYDQTLPLPAGTWFFVVERSPEGAFSFALAAQ
jgi:hypothetical protein